MNKRDKICMENVLTLNRLPVGKFGKVKTLKAEGSIRRRLQDIGIIDGTMIECVQKSPAGDPIAYLIRGAVIALRSEDSSQIVLE